MEWPTVCDRQLRYLTPVISDSVFCGQEDEEIMGGTREMKDTAQKDFIAFPDIAIRMIRVLSGESDTEDIGDWLCQKGIREEDEVTVCELFDQYVKQGREEGWEEGKAEGKARQLVEDIENTMNFFHVTLEKACESLGITVSRYEEAKRI